VNQAQAQFIDCLGRAAVSACGARGGTADIGQGLNRMVARHHEVGASIVGQHVLRPTDSLDAADSLATP